MALSNLANWNEANAAGSACGAGDNFSACGSGDNLSACGSSCGSGDKLIEKAAACGSSCGSGDK